MKNKIKKILKDNEDKINEVIRIIKNNKMIIVLILISSFSIYYWGIRPSNIRKECSTIMKYQDSYINSDYNESKERQKQKDLVDYIQCRNNNLIEVDQIFINKQGYSPYLFTQDQYNTLSVLELNKLAYEAKYPMTNSLSGTSFDFEDSMRFIRFDLDELNKFTLGPLSKALGYKVYNGYWMSAVEYNDLKENKNKYPLCYFPNDFLEREITPTGKYEAKASDLEYKFCLREHGIKEDKILTPQQIKDNIDMCHKWYGNGQEYKNCLSGND